MEKKNTNGTGGELQRITADAASGWRGMERSFIVWKM
jgi:hypothetical protein